MVSGFRLENFGNAFDVQARQSSLNVDLTNQNDSRLAVGRNPRELPAGFDNDFAIVDSGQSSSDRSTSNPLMQLQMMMRIMQQMILILQMMMQLQAMQNQGQGGSANGDGGGGGTKPNDGGGTKPNDGGGTKPNDGGGTKPNDDGGTKPNDGGGTKPIDGGGTKPNDGGDGNDDTDGKYANTGVQRGKTIFRDDFSGARGELPNQTVFDSEHIGVDGNQRQRGPSIDEDAITRKKNTVKDGKGHLVLFPEKERTWDEVGQEYVNYTKGTYNTTKGLHFNLKDHPEGIVVEVRAKHPTAPGAKFNALWIMTEKWSADPAKGESKGDTIEYDAAEGGGADIAIHYPVRGADGKSKDNYGGGAHPDIDFNDGKFHTYTVVIKPNASGRGDVVQYVDGQQVFAKKDVFPGDKELHLRSSLEISPKWTKKVYTGEGGMDSDGAGVIDYVDVSSLKMV